MVPNAAAPWPRKPLIDVLEVLESGRRPKGGVRGISDGVPSVGGEHLTSDGSFDFTNTKYVPPDFFASMSSGRIQPQDVLIVKDGATTGKTSFVGPDFPFERAAVNEHVFICRAEGIMPEYLFWYLFSDVGQAAILEHFRGSAQGGINRQFASGTLIPVPPTRIQQEIVALASTSHKHAQSASAHVSNTRRAIASFRGAVMLAACTGGLTEGWRASNPNADSVEAALAGRRTDHGKKHERAQALIDLSLPELPDTYLVSDIRTASDALQYGISSSLTMEPEGLPVLRMGNIQDGVLDISRLKYSDSEEAERLVLAEGDLLFNRTNSPELVGKSAVFHGESDRDLSFASYLIRARLSPELALPDFVNYWINSAWGRLWARHVKTDGVSQSNINGTKLGAMPLPLPPISEQHEIVRRASHLLENAIRMTARIDTVDAAISGSSRAVLLSALSDDGS